jgi:hypothetical protein
MRAAKASRVQAYTHRYVAQWEIGQDPHEMAMRPLRAPLTVWATCGSTRAGKVNGNLLLGDGERVQAQRGPLWRDSGKQRGEAHEGKLQGWRERVMRLNVAGVLPSHAARLWHLFWTRAVKFARIADEKLPSGWSVRMQRPSPAVAGRHSLSCGSSRQRSPRPRHGAISGRARPWPTPHRPAACPIRRSCDYWSR